MYRIAGLGEDIQDSMARVVTQTILTEKQEKVDRILDHADETLTKADSGIEAVKWAAIFGLGLFGVLNLARLMKKKRKV